MTKTYVPAIIRHSARYLTSFPVSQNVSVSIFVRTRGFDKVTRTRFADCNPLISYYMKERLAQHVLDVFEKLETRFVQNPRDVS